MESEFQLYNLEDDKLDLILSLNDTDSNIYVNALIEKFYPDIDSKSEIHADLMVAYRSSFVAERFYRSNLVFQSGFQAVYTRTGLIRNLINDIYFAEDDLIVH